MSRSRAAVLLTALIAALAGSGSALAYLTARIPGANAEAVAGSVGRVSGLALVGNSSPTANPDVELSWHAATLSDGRPVDGYLVTSYDGSTAAVACESPVESTGCTARSLPDGVYGFAVRARFASWTGEESRRLSVVVDTSAPAIEAVAAGTGGAPSFVFTHPDYSRFVCQLDDEGAFSADSCEPSDLAPGIHVLAVEAEAEDGSLTTAATYTWTVTAAGPVTTATTESVFGTSNTVQGGTARAARGVPENRREPA